MTIIVLEGIDGTGKTTHVEWLGKRLMMSGQHIQWLRDPGDTQAGEAIRAIVKDKSIPLDHVAQILMFTAARYQLALEKLAPGLYAEEITKPAIQKTIRILDRWWPSTIAYQSVRNPELKDMIVTLNEMIMGRLDYPEIVMPFVIILDAPPEVTLRRVAKAVRTDQPEQDRFENLEFLTRVRENYIELSKTMGFPLVDATRSIDEVADDIWMLVQSQL